MWHYGDITKIDGHTAPPVDVITGGSPCQDLSVAGKRAGLAGERSGLFMEQMRIVKEMREASKDQLIAEFGENFDRTKIKPKYMVWENVCTIFDTLIETSNGLKKIGEIQSGEMVRTHDGTYHKVVRTYKTEMQPTIKIKYQGGELVCTPNHPLLTESGDYKPASEFAIGDRVGFKVDEPGTKSIGMATAYAFGRWLADGSVAIRNDRKTKHRIFISTGYKKYEDLKSELSKLPYKINEYKMDWAINFTFSSDEFGELTDSAGYGARNKQVPEWVFDLVAEERDEVLRGYLAGDGSYSETKKCWSFATSSEKLAYGLARLIRAVYHIGPSLRLDKGKGTICIEGRPVNAHDSWRGSFSWPISSTKVATNSPIYKDGYIWSQIRKITEGETQDVYNLSVEDNNTYIANSVVCHNCGAFSSGTPAGSDFGAVLEEIVKVVCHECPSVPIPKEGWPTAGNLDGVGDDGTPFSICWRLHDAQYWGVPQRRRRIALVADFGGITAPEILFEREGMSGDSGKSGKTWQAITRNTPSGLTKSGEEYIIRSSMPCSTPDAPHITKTLDNESEAITYGICSYDSNSMKSDNPESGIYVADTSRTLDLNGGNPACNQGGMAVVQGADLYNGRMTGDVAATLTCVSGTPDGSGPKVVSFEPGAASRVGGHVYEDDVAGTLRANAGDNQQAIVTSASNAHPAEPVLLESNQNHATIQTDGVSTTLPASMGEGGGYVPMVCIEGNGARESHKGDGYSESETMYTLNTVEQHAVAYGVTTKGNGDAFINSETHTALSTGGGEPGQGYPCVLEQKTVAYAADTYERYSEQSQATTLRCKGSSVDNLVVDPSQSDKLPSDRVWSQADTVGALCADDYKGAGNQYVSDGKLIIHMSNGADSANQVYSIDQGAGKSGCNVPDGVAPTLTTAHQGEPAVCYGLDRAAYNQGPNAKFDFSVEEDKAQTLVARGPGAVMTSTFKKDSHAKSSEDGQGWVPTDINDTLNAFDSGETRTPTLVVDSHPQDSRWGIKDDGVVQTLASNAGEGGGNVPLVLENPPMVDSHPQELCQGFDSYNISMTGAIAKTLQAEGGGTGVNEGCVVQGTTPMVLENHPNDSRIKIREDGVVQTLSSRMGTGGNNTPMVLESSDAPAYCASHTTFTTNFVPDASPTLSASDYKEPPTVLPQPSAIVRRLTPIECERLQGFFDNWTDLGEWVDENGKKHQSSDSPRYKALGNSIALPFWYWMSARMIAKLKESGVEKPTMASLFDGIAGFPLVYLSNGCRPMWTSEIESFPIAVCKKHFGDEATGEIGDVYQYLGISQEDV